jgi:PAS domain-containing protein
MAGRPHSDFLPPEAVARYRADDLKVLQSGEPLLDVHESMEDGGSVRHFRVDRVPYRDATGEIIGLIVVAYDVTQ